MTSSIDGCGQVAKEYIKTETLLALQNTEKCQDPQNCDVYIDISGNGPKKYFDIR